MDIFGAYYTASSGAPNSIKLKLYVGSFGLATFKSPIESTNRFQQLPPVLSHNSNPLEVAVNMQFTYRVHVPGYVNKSEPHPCYSSDTSLPRKVFHFEDYNNNHSESVHPKNYSDENENIGIHFNNCSSVAHNEEESVTSNSNVINNDEYPEDNFEKTREIVEYNMDDDNSTLYPHSFVNQVLDNTSLAGWVP